MKERILDTFTMPAGFEVDLQEGWKKIISSMFGGNPGRGFGELIQNFMDSYEANVPFTERRGIIETEKQSISITDFGSGLDKKKIELIMKLGGTDKAGDKSKIGMFGVGFFSIFNPRLGTEKVSVTTNCEGTPVTILFDVRDSETPPDISVYPGPEDINYSTRVKVFFDRSHSVEECLQAARHALKHYPCKVTIDGEPLPSIWEDAYRTKSYLFQTETVHGFIQRNSGCNQFHLMCKYEPIMSMSIYEFVTGGHGIKYTFEDLYSDSIPYLPDSRIYANCNELRVPLGRNSYYLDVAWHNMKSELSKVMIDYLNSVLVQSASSDLIVPNQYILRNELSEYFHSDKKEEVRPAIQKLADIKIYQINGKKELFSLQDIKNMKTEDLPLYFSQHQLNLGWLGGQFKHDFIVLAPNISKISKIPKFYDDLLDTLFYDVVNLDTIQQDNHKLNDLVTRGIIDREAIKPEIRIVGEKELTETEQTFLSDIKNLLETDVIKQAISENLQFNIERLIPVFIYVKGNQGYISSGLFDMDGFPIDEYYISNYLGEENEVGYKQPVNLILGISLNHPFVRQLIDSDNPYRIYYSLTYLANELALSQKLLVPYSRFFHFVKDKLAASMRRALMSDLLSRSKAA